MWGASRFASRLSPKSVILASCNVMRRPYVACHACSNVYFHFFINKFSIASIIVVFIGYLLSNSLKTSIFDDFGLLLAFFGHFFLSSPKLLNIFDSSFQRLLPI